MFNSQSINADPMPWLDVFGHGRKREQRYENDYFDPRPEFDNRPNPILVAFRESRAHSVTDSTLSEHAAYWLRGLPDSLHPAHLDHARKVLEKLAALS